MINRYIDADALIAEFPHDEDWDYPVNTNSYVVETINSAPSIDIIRCKDCKHWCCHDDVDYDQTEFIYYCKTNKTTFKGDDFCSHGERKGASDE